LYPGSEGEVALTLVGGKLIGKAAPVAMGYLNTLPVLGDTLPQLGGRISGWASQGVANLSAPRTLNSQFGGLLIDASGTAPYSELVPSGGLAAHEAAGGHLLLKHVGQTEQQLLDRLVNEPNITGSSSFYDRATAESAISKALDARQGDVGTWLATSKPQMKLEYALQSPVGISVDRGMTSAVDRSGLRLILRRDPAMPAGYRIHTGFPTQ
jgi:hypothetical protein